jgi:hypothetical protein
MKSRADGQAEFAARDSIDQVSAFTIRFRENVKRTRATLAERLDAMPPEYRSEIAARTWKDFAQVEDSALSDLARFADESVPN